MKNEDLELAYDEVCNGCDLATMNSNDGGKMPCHNHKRLFMLRTYPVIRTNGLMDGEWTHTWVDTPRVRQLITGILEEWEESGGERSIDTFVHDLGVSVEPMTKEDFEKVPEL